MGQALGGGFHAVRMTSGLRRTERLTPTLYNSGLSGITGRFFWIDGGGIYQIYFAGYSMGGNW